MRPSQFLAAAVAFSSLSAASWSGEAFNGMAVRDLSGLLYGRQDSSESSQPTATSNSPQSTGDSKASSGSAASSDEPKSTGSATASGDNKSTGKITGSATKATGKASGTSGGNSTSFDARLPAGGLQMITPAATAGQQYYKIGDWVTFAWNYTSVSVMPTAIDVLATCTANQGTYTLAVNMSAEETGLVLWDTGAYQSTGTLPLLTETYTLVVYDADSSVSATARAGYLGVYNQFSFGMYTPQPYTPWSSFKCATCSAAISEHERNAFTIIAITGAITLFSFLGFASNFGLW